MRKFFDNKATWVFIGGLAGAALGEKAAAVANAVGALVMAVL